MRGMLLCAVRFVGRALASEGNVCILHVLVRFEWHAFGVLLHTIRSAL
jgi:hypothetical protein